MAILQMLGCAYNLTSRKGTLYPESQMLEYKTAVYLCIQHRVLNMYTLEGSLKYRIVFRHPHVDNEDSHHKPL